jgi:O-antigen/teichoic acid export membrane protein
MFGISIVDTLYPFLDKAILGAMLPLECVGIYRVAESVASLNSVFVSPFIAFWPYISKLYSEDRLDELRDAYRSINLIIVAFMVPLTLILLEMSGYILSFFGSAFALRGRTVFLILALGCVVDAVAGPAGAVLRMTRHSRLSLFINMGLLAAYIVLSFMLVGRYGLLGIAAAKAAVMVLGNAANVIANYLLLRIFPYTWKHGWLLALGTAVFAASLLLPGSSRGIETHCAVAFAEAAAFLGLAFIVLGAQRKRLMEQIRALLPAARS